MNSPQTWLQDSSSGEVAVTARYYGIGGMTLAVTADLPITDSTFQHKFAAFQVEQPDDDLITLRHHFALPELATLPPAIARYRFPPWVIERHADGWCYQCVMPDERTLANLALFSTDYRTAELYQPSDRQFCQGNWHSLTFFPTDQVLLSALLADRQGAILHSAGMVIDGHGLLFIGHSGAGKSTTVNMLRECGTILCDDRNIVRRHADGFHIYGTWSHGEVPTVSPEHAPLRAVFFLEQSSENRLIPYTDRREIMHRLLLTLIKPLATAEWYEKTIPVLEQLADEMPVYRLQLDTSGAVRQVIHRLLQE